MTSRANITGLGLWVPDAVRGNEAWPAAFSASFHGSKRARRERDFTLLDDGASPRPYDELYLRHGARHEDDPFKGATLRRVQASEVPVAVGDAEAARRAMADARVHPRDIDLVLSSALVPDRVVPSNGPAIQHRAGCVNAAGIAVESYCSAALAQLDLAVGMVESGRARHVLCVQSHQIARANDLEQPFSPMFGDASAAFVVGPVEEGGVAGFLRSGDGSLEGAVTFESKRGPGAVWYRDPFGPVHPGSSDLAGARFVGRHLLAFAIDTVREVARRAAVPVDALSAVCMIQPLVWFQPAVAEGLNISPDRVPSTYGNFAHIGGAGVVANLIAARQAGLLRRGSPVALYGHGAGLTRYGAVLRWSGGADASHEERRARELS